jgi:hypothetical protein
MKLSEQLKQQLLQVQSSLEICQQILDKKKGAQGPRSNFSPQHLPNNRQACGQLLTQPDDVERREYREEN